MEPLRVENMTSPASLRKVPNQFIIHTREGEYFQSYRTVVAFVNQHTGEICLDKLWDYSNTTRKYLYRFLGFGFDRNKVLRMIEEGKITITDLNL